MPGFLTRSTQRCLHAPCTENAVVRQGGGMQYLLEPDVAGGLGPQTVMNTSVHPPLVTRLHYEFAGWGGDDLVESFPCFLVTERLADAIAAAGLTGATFDDALTSIDPQIAEVAPEEVQGLPERWRWLQVGPRESSEDFWLAPAHQLWVSECAMELLRTFNLSRCEITPMCAFP